MQSNHHIRYIDSGTSHAAGSKDPVCGMDVTPEGAAASTEYKGQTYYFCSSGCMAKFRAEPMKYAGREDGPPSSV